MAITVPTYKKCHNLMFLIEKNVFLGKILLFIFITIVIDLVFHDVWEP